MGATPLHLAVQSTGAGGTAGAMFYLKACVGALDPSLRVVFLVRRPNAEEI